MSKIFPIENVHLKNEFREIGLRVFRSQDPFDLIFKPKIEACLIFHPLEDDPSDGDYLTKEQYEAIIAAAKHVGDTGFVLCNATNRLVDDPKYRWGLTSAPGEPGKWIKVEAQELAEYWWCEFPNYEDYRAINMVGVLDTAVYSIDAGWGLLTAHECHTLVGGNVDFISHVDKMYPAWRDNVMTVLTEWEGKMVQGEIFIADLLVELVHEWKKWPGDEWAETFTEELDFKLRYGL